MSTEVTASVALNYEDKARMLLKVREWLIAIKEIDERITLEREEWIPWWEEQIPIARDIETLGAAIRIEMETRRGEALAKESERRGGDQKSEVARNQSVALPHFANQTDSKAHSERQKRKEARELGSTPERAVTTRAYIRKTVHEGKKPSMRAALKEVRNVFRAPTPQPEQPLKSAAYDRDRVRRTMYDRIQEVLAGEQPTDLGSAFHGGYSSSISLIEWLDVTSTPKGRILSIDREFFAYCSRRALTPALQPLIEELTERRRDFAAFCAEPVCNPNTPNSTMPWVSRETKTLRQIEILNWLETQLSERPDYYGTLERLRNQLHERRKDYWTAKNKNTFITEIANLTNITAEVDWIEGELVKLVNPLTPDTPPK